MKTIRVRLGERSYPIVLGTDILDALPGLASGVASQIAVVTDARVAALHLRGLTSALRKEGCQVIEIVMPRGERQKSLARANSIITRLLESRYSRRSAVLAFGGGVVGDVTGFAAATFRRGIPLIQVPTTLLAQVESAIGGKTAVNHPLSKNAIGAYHQPSLVFSDTAFLSTLPRREIICGIGEILKYGMLDRGIFAYLDAHIGEILAGTPEAIREIVYRCNVVKAKLIHDDEREERSGGGRAVLNLGHTVGHALEDLSLYRLRHGEAVVLGLRWELRIALAAGRVDRADAALFEDLFRRIPYHPAIGYIPRDRVIEKIVAHGATTGFVIPRKIGTVVVARDIPAAVIRAVSRAFRP